MPYVGGERNQVKYVFAKDEDCIFQQQTGLDERRGFMPSGAWGASSNLPRDGQQFRDTEDRTGTITLGS